MKIKKFIYALSLIMFLLSLSNQKIQAVELIINGGFETGDFTGWTRVPPAEVFRPWAVGPSGSGGNAGIYFPYPTATVVQQGTFNAWQGVVNGANQSNILYQDVTIPAGAGYRTLIRWNHRYQMNYTQLCSTGCGTATFAVEILNTSNVLRQTLYVVNTLTNTNTNTGYVNLVANLSAYQGQTIRLRFRTTTTQRLQGPGQLEIDAVSIQHELLTAANATVSGRVLTDGGRGISFANVTLTDQTGNVRTATTNQFGVYYFEGVESAQNYIVSVEHKKYVFPNNPRAVNVSDDLTGVDFLANP